VSRSTFVRVAATLAILAAVAPVHTAAAQRHGGLSISPFVSYVPSAAANPLAGLGLALAGGSWGLRASADVALENDPASAFPARTGSLRPWGADADLLLFLGGSGSTLSQLFDPFVFAGLGTTETNVDGFEDRRSNWSYGFGLSVPFGSAIDLFGESRWRMSQFMLPTASNAFAPKTELRAGVAFHVGGGSSDTGHHRRSRRHRG
jgi:opacity protein-like surface antigen